MSFLPHSWVLCWVSWIRLAHFLWDLWQGQISWGDKEGDVSCFLAISNKSTMTVYHHKSGIPTNNPPTNKKRSLLYQWQAVTTNIPQSRTTWTANSIIIFILFMHTLQSLGNQPFSPTTLTQTLHRPVPLLLQSQGISQLFSLPTHGIR